jgi:magnesium transporter
MPFKEHAAKRSRESRPRMIIAYTRTNDKISDQEFKVGQTLPENTIWLDLQTPSDDERNHIAKALGIELPTILEMQEIEASNRLYTDKKSIFLTIDILAGADTPNPTLDALLIAATPSCLVTMRNCQPKSVNTFATRIKQQPELFATIEDGLLAILDAITDRIADILEVLGKGADTLSQQIFRRGQTQPEEKRLQEILLGIGRVGDTTHKVRDSISGISRLVAYLGPVLTPRLTTEQAAKFTALDRDVSSLREHTQFINEETTFLLDATLGQINIEQNNIIKILSIVMVAFTPPTFFASMWGMNFHNMPEYNWEYGYPMAWCVMIVSAIFPILYFKKRNWL